MRKKEKYFFNNRIEKQRLELKFDAGQAKQQLLDTGFKKGMGFLDVGCGTGAMLKLVKKIDKDNKNIFGIDSSQDFLIYAASRENRANYCASNTYKLPFKDNTFDFIWCRLLLEHLLSPQEAIKEMKRVLRKGGILSVGDLDGNCVFHYPINKDLEGHLNGIIKLAGPFGFDPFVGRKLFHFLNELSFRHIQVKLYPYHNIFGTPKKTDLINWTIKINSVMEFLNSHTQIPRDSLQKMKKAFLDYIKDKNTFTYSTMIFAKGIK